MRLNEHTVIEGNRVLLVPYEERHVVKYHNWMKSPELQILTASEPLSLEEEYEMQKTWREDLDKCTFIILCKNKYLETKDEVEAMVGDTNIFLKNEMEIAEVEIMIAEDSAKGKGLGKEAVLLMIRYGILHLNLKTFRAVILNENKKSISLFESLGFIRIAENTIFNEIILEAEITDAWSEFIKLKTEIYTEKMTNQL